MARNQGKGGQRPRRRPKKKGLSFGSLSVQLKTVEDLMLKGKKIPLINENTKMRAALKIITKKK